MMTTEGSAWRVAGLGLVLGGLVQALGCAGGAATDGDGVVLLALAAPAEVRCVRMSFEGGGRAVEREVAPTGGGPRRLEGLPTGPVRLAGAAFGAACGVGEPLWRSEPATVTLPPGRPVAVTMTFRPNGIVDVSSSFVGDGDGGAPPDDASTSFPGVLFGCRAVTLEAVKRYDPVAFSDADRTFEPALVFALPAALDVAEGNAGDGAVLLTYRDAPSGTTRACHYRSESIVSETEPSGARYIFDRCDGGEAAGDTVTADRVGLRVEDGAVFSPAGRTLVRAQLAEAEPCAGRPTVSVNPVERDPRLLTLAAADGTRIESFGRRDAEGHVLGIDFVAGVSPTGERVTVELEQGAVRRIWGEGGVSLSFRRVGPDLVRVRIDGPGSAPVETTISGADARFGAPFAPGATPVADDPAIEVRASALASPAGVSLVRVTSCAGPVQDALVEMQVLTRLGLTRRPGAWISSGTYQVDLPLSGPGGSDAGENAGAICENVVDGIVTSCQLFEAAGGPVTATFLCSRVAAATGPAFPGVLGVCMAGVAAAAAVCLYTPLNDALGSVVCEHVPGFVDALTEIYPIGLIPRVRIPGSTQLFYPANNNFVTVATPAGPFPDFSVDVGGKCSTPLPTCDVRLSPTVVSVPPRGGSHSARVDVFLSCDWRAAADVPWISVETPSGNSAGTLRFSVAANTEPFTRFGHIDVGGATLVVTQGGASNCSFQVGPTAFSYLSGGGAGQVNVLATASDCTWTARSDASWLVANRSSGAGTGVVDFTLPPNAGPRRTARLSVAGSDVVVTQEGNGSAPPPFPPPGGGPCSVTLSPESATFNRHGGLGTITVRAPRDCPWVATTDDGFIHLSSDRGLGNGEVRYGVSLSNYGGRTGHIRVGDRTFTVVQDNPVVTCAYGLDHLSRRFPANGGNAEVKVYTNFALCPYKSWTDFPDWIHLDTVGQNGVGQGTVRYSVSRNPSTGPRHGTITFMNVFYQIDQDGQESCRLDVSPTTIQAPAKGMTGSVTVAASRFDCPWTIKVNDPEWIRLTGSTTRAGTGMVELSVGANPSPSVRTLSLTVAGKTITIPQAGNGPAARQLTASVTGPGTISLPTGQSCGTACAWPLPDGGTVTLAATPTADGTFQGWGDACASAGTTATCTVLVDRDLVVSARFGAAPPPLTLAVTVTGGGRVVVNDSTTCTATCTSQHQRGSKVSLVAVAPTGGAVFRGWSGACAGTSARCDVVMDGAMKVTAAFGAAPPPPSPILVAQLDVANRGPVPVPISQGGAHTLKVSVPKGLAQAWVSLQRHDGAFWTVISEVGCTSSGAFTTCQDSKAVTLATTAEYRWELKMVGLPAAGETQGGQATLTRP